MNKSKFPDSLQLKFETNWGSEQGHIYAATMEKIIKQHNKDSDSTDALHELQLKLWSKVGLLRKGNLQAVQMTLTRQGGKSKAINFAKWAGINRLPEMSFSSREAERELLGSGKHESTRVQRAEEKQRRTQRISA